ncbi:MAG: hypothetical protein B7Y45_10050 [Sphingomonas sp. 28-66-16]|nr:MAG: hypothetical protein B7Y45_10050 [Sphingomonas sp. 28-66-16]
MSEQKRLKLLSDTTRAHLAAGEGQLVDFKRAPDGVSADDLVAFANAANGGTILAGVGEQSVDGAQVGVVLGCDVSDNTILQLLNKAISCIPPVSIDVVIENLNDRPILRIGVQSSPTKPHCTPKGLYCRRDGARNRALHPSELLKIFLDTEAQVFAERFESAAAHISEEIGNLEGSLANTIKNMSDQLGWADSNLDDTSHTINTVLAYAKLIKDETDDTATRLRTIFRQDTRDDPIRAREKKKLVDLLVEQISEDKGLTKAVLEGHPLNYTMTGKPALELTEQDGQEALAEAYKAIRDREDKKQYKAKCVAPGECDEVSLTAISAFIARDGDQAEIAAGLGKAFRLGFTSYKGQIVASAVLKKPNATSRSKLFERTDADADPKHFKIQLDCIYLHPDHHGKGALSKLITKLLSAVKGEPVFSVVMLGDTLQRQVLEHMKFKAAILKPHSHRQTKRSDDLFLLAK